MVNMQCIDLLPFTMGLNSPICTLESTYGHIFVIHFNTLTSFGHKIANRDTKDIMNPNEIRISSSTGKHVPPTKMTTTYLDIIFKKTIPSFQMFCISASYFVAMHSKDTGPVYNLALSAPYCLLYKHFELKLNKGMATGCLD